VHRAWEVRQRVRGDWNGHPGRAVWSHAARYSQKTTNRENGTKTPHFGSANLGNLFSHRWLQWLGKMGDWGIKGQDLDQRYAKFGRSLLTDQEVWNLSKAHLVCDGDPIIACKLFLTSRSETAVYASDVYAWACMVGEGIATAMYKPKGAQRRRRYSEIESEMVRHQAALDGVVMAMFGKYAVPTLFERREEFAVDERSYRKIRDFVGGVAATLIANYSFALEYAWGYVRSRVCDSILENLSPEFEVDNDTFGGESEEIQNSRFAPGCTITTPAPASDSVDAWPE